MTGRITILPKIEVIFNFLFPLLRIPVHHRCTERFYAVHVCASTFMKQQTDSDPSQQQVIQMPDLFIDGRMGKFRPEGPGAGDGLKRFSRCVGKNRRRIFTITAPKNPESLLRKTGRRQTRINCIKDLFMGVAQLFSGQIIHVRTAACHAPAL